MISTGWGAGRRTDRFSDGIKALQLRERPLAAVPLLSLYRKTRAGVDYFIGGGAGRACMNDLVVKTQAIDMVEISLRLLRLSDVVQTSWRNRKSRCELLASSETHWSTTKSDGIVHEGAAFTLVV